jgi:hypothetical protein
MTWPISPKDKEKENLFRVCKCFPIRMRREIRK